MRENTPASGWGLTVVLLGLAAASAASTVYATPSSRQAQAAAVIWFGAGAATGLFTWRAARSDARATQTETTSASLARPARWTASMAVGVLALIGLTAQGTVGRANLSPDPTLFLNQPDVDAALWLASHTTSTDVVMAGQAAIVHRVTGRHVVAFPVTSDPQAIMSRIQEQGVRFLVVKTMEKNPYFLPVEEERLRALTHRYPGALRLAQRGPGYEVFDVGVGASERPG